MRILAVASLNRLIRDLLELEPRLQSVWLEGEVSNFRQMPSGHCYFTLKDALAQLRCVWFAGNIGPRARIPRDGDLVVAHGRVTVYEPRGEYQLNVNLVQPAGVGELQLQFEELRARLEREGLFDEARKRPLPRVPEVIGLVTSTSGAVLHDFLQVLARRFPATHVVVAPTPVQGEAAVLQLCGAIEALNAIVRPDVIVVARGGGSLEDLWCFNDEAVARAIYGSRAPIVTGIGHETDVTIADLVADLRAPTPSAAAEMVVPDGRESGAWLTACAARLHELAIDRLHARGDELAALEHRLERVAPARAMANRRQALDDLLERASTVLHHRVELARAGLLGRSGQLAALSPLAVLDRGYAIVRHGGTGAVVRSAAEVYGGEPLEVRVAAGRFNATADSPTGGESWPLTQSTSPSAS